MATTITKAMRGNAGLDLPPPLRPRGSIGKGLRKEPLPRYDCITVVVPRAMNVVSPRSVSTSSDGSSSFSTNQGRGWRIHLAAVCSRWNRQTVA